MHRNLSCRLSNLRFLTTSGRVNSKQLKVSVINTKVRHFSSNFSPVIAKTFNFEKNFSKPIIKDNVLEITTLQLLNESRRLSEQITALTGNDQKLRCVFLASGSFSAITQFAIWMCGHAAVPLSQAHPSEQMEYFINDSAASLIIATSEFEAKLRPLAEKLNKPLLIIDHAVQTITEEDGIDDLKNFVQTVPCKGEDSALIVYTSGTTSNPKGVVLTHNNLGAQISSLTSAWNMTSTDTLLHTLPLHHVHGLINALLLPLSVGAKVIMLPKFDTDEAWSRLLSLNTPPKDRVNVFMAVPTVYSYLIQEFDKLFKNKSQMAEYIRTHCSTKIRLMISGSAPLPETTFKRWKEITGHNLLERYGMTEIGMALSNPLIEDEKRKRIPGHIGNPLPGVEARIVSYENNKEILKESKGEFNVGFWNNELKSNESDPAAINNTAKSETKPVPAIDNSSVISGSLQIRGPSVFKEYFNKPEATQESFTDDGWFITGDSAAFLPHLDCFKILGRNSVDIIKCKAYKISALEMETKLLEHPSIQDCAVFGMPDEILGQKIIALVVTKNEVKAEELSKWCLEKFAKYSQPTIKIIESVPRNLMGKVNKKDLIKLFS